jgi:RHS repeat-associated protein
VETWAETAGANDTAFVWADIVQRFDYDTKGNLRADTSAVGGATSYVTDAMGRVTNVYDPLKTRTERAYDALNRVTLFRQYTTALAHPSISNPLATCEATQVVCSDGTVAWDGFPASLSTTFAHNNSAVKSVTDPRSVVRSYGYEGRGLINRETDDFGTDELSFYGPSGLLDSVEARTGKTVRQYYDAAGRRRALAFSSVASPVPGSSETVPPDSIRYTYDKMSNLLTAVSREGTIRRDYYTNGLLKRKIMEWQASLNIDPDTISYIYDETGAIRKINHGADSTRYHYTESTGVLDSMVVWLGAGVNLRKSFLFTWDSLGRRRTVSYPTWPGANNRMTVRFRYDKLGTIRRIVSNHPQGAITDRFTFTYRNRLVDPIGRILKDSLTCASSSTTCGGSNQVSVVNSYNRRSELVRQIQTLGASLVSTDSMRFDNSGNMIFRARGEPADTHVYSLSAGAHNRLSGWTRTAIPNTTRAVTYRNDGSRLREVRAPWNNQAPEERYYYYDGLGRTSGTGEWISPTLFSDQATACQYDADGRMIGPCDPFSPKLVFDGDNSSGTGVTSEGFWRFFHGPGLDDPLMGYFRGGTNGPRLFYWVTDGNGREFAVADSTASLGSNDNNGPIGAYRYAGGTKAANSFGANRFSSSSAPKLSFFRNRAYDQESGRWTQEDPIGVAGGLNLYQFNGNNPVTFTDPFGLCPEDVEECPANEKFIQLMGAHGRGIEAAVGIQTAVVGTVLTAGAGAELLTAGGTVALGIARAAPVAGGALEPSQRMVGALQRQLSQHGVESLKKSAESIGKQLSEHLTKLADTKAAGGRTSSIEREIRTFRRQLNAIRRLLEK